jgi:hypothetical protein
VTTAPTTLGSGLAAAVSVPIARLRCSRSRNRQSGDARSEE